MENDVVNGSVDALNALQLSQGKEALDTTSKNILANKEFLAVILHLVVPEYKGYSASEIEKFIEQGSVSVGETDVSNGRTNTQVEGINAEFKILNEKTTTFDILFKAINPVLSDLDASPVLTVHLHVDVEPQKDYRPGYPIEKRGIYYLAREISSQLGAITEKTDYGALEKCYSIFICRDHVPEKEAGSVSTYAFRNTENVGIEAAPNKDYDLMEMVIIRLGKRKDPDGKDIPEPDVVRFLNSFFFKKDPEQMIQELSEFVDFTENVRLLQEVKSMSGLGQSVFEEGKTEGQEMLGKLIQILLKDNNIEAINIVSVDAGVREEYYKKYNIH